MKKLPTNFVNGMPILASTQNETNTAINKLIDAVEPQGITYAQLIALCNENKLQPGQTYRITDYVTMVNPDIDNIRSAGHQFDIIVKAISESTISEHANAILHNEDDYFAKSILSAWKIWYSINNDTNRFAWADPNGKGVIYRLIDENNNDCPYDFKNIQFKRYAITNITSSSLTEDALNNLKSTFCYSQNNGKCFATKDVYGNWVPQDANGTSYEIDEDITAWYYTFHGMKSNDGETISDQYDMSTHQLKLDDDCIQNLVDDGSGANTKDECHDNIIKPAYYEYLGDDEYYKGRQVLNNIVFVNGMSYCYYNEEDEYWEYQTSSCYGNVFGVECKNSTFGNGCGSNTFGNNCYRNTFGNYFQSNTFGNDCGSNTFGNYCYYNSFGNDFRYNTFGNDCYWNTFGNNFQQNTFGNGCNNNTFGNYCYYNSFGNNCYYNTFGNDCYSNTFGNNCFGNTTSNYFQNNTFGNNCYNNTFGNNCWNNTFGNYVRTITVFDGVQYVSVTGGTSSSSYVQNAQILNGTQGTDDNNKLTIGFAANKKYTQFAALNSSNNLVIWTPADI